MTTLDSLERTLRQQVEATTSSAKQPLSDAQYSAGFGILGGGSGGRTYQDFIIPQLSQLLAPLFDSCGSISALEIGPGATSILGHLPNHLRRKVRRYTAFEPNSLFATRLGESFSSPSKAELLLPCLETPPNIHPISFTLQGDTTSGIGTGDNDEKFDLILFCHSMYGMKPKTKFIERALAMLDEQNLAMAVVIHRDSIYLDGLVCHQTASFPTGVVRVADDDESLGCFATFIAGFTLEDRSLDKAVQTNSPEVMMAFTKHATALSELTAKVPLEKGNPTVKNWEARLHRPISVVRPTEVRHVQQCVRWALVHKVGLTVVGGGHSGHCLMSNVVAINMGAFDQVHILAVEQEGTDSRPDGDIVSKTMAAGVTVPLGARPSVGAGLWLQGGIGHQARLHGLACDAIVGAVLVSVKSGEVLYVGIVPSQHRPTDAVCPENEDDLMWAIKGAGSNFGIVISVTFKALPDPTYLVEERVFPLSDSLEAQLTLSNLDSVFTKLSRNCSADAYLYWDAGQLQLGVTTFEASMTPLASARSATKYIDGFWGDCRRKVVNSVGLFETDLYLSGMHGGHARGKTFAFKRCLFLKHIGDENVAGRLLAAVQSRPTPLCYLHLLHGGEAVSDVAREETAFGCRDWEFACVITGVWSRDQDDTEAAQAAMRWVYHVAEDLLPVSSGAYGADLGPDPRDAALARNAFGPNRPRLARLKHSLDPRNVLAYACPLPKAPTEPKLIILVTGKSGTGKDYCASVWVSIFNEHAHKSLTARAVSISDKIKREYAAAKDADLKRLLEDRCYKEKHRPALTRFYLDQMHQRPQLREEHFLDVVHSSVNVDVLFITGMRDEAPVAAFSHLVPDRRLLEVHVQASKTTRRARRECPSGDDDVGEDSMSTRPALDYCPHLIFDNEAIGTETARRFAEQYLLPFVHMDLQRLATMVRSVPGFPRPGIEFRHVLAIVQQPGGLALCSSLLHTHFSSDWAKVGAIVSCEAGGFVFASPLALRVSVPLVLIREAGKLPPPTVSVSTPRSHISTWTFNNPKEKQIEMEHCVVREGMSLVVVDDVLATGRTLCAILHLLRKAEVSVDDVSVMVVAEFPVHRGRELLRERGFGGVRIQSLLVFGGT
ncbi:phosphoribosyl transferase domain protein [Bimuria novae-zelandiae CBS 107.79]|uniref:Phosphoribosyl transferase domain protein n=1 Tax=Bimuria novae-zelandiae CBS 107.79 TaxID=1447943 RepID=A0A6A5VC19_9PLEO|nr:phosphoribosyl transferase domain protein [Bimuria novae-zelandiae CBS 107.79]